MAGTPYLVDSNVLLRWVKPDDRDYPLVISAIDASLQRGAVFCYTSQNVAEFWNTCTRPLDRNGYGLSPQEADRRGRLFEDKLQPRRPRRPLVCPNCERGEWDDPVRNGKKQ
jgi:hypothetical protein